MLLYKFNKYLLAAFLSILCVSEKAFADAIVNANPVQPNNKAAASDEDIAVATLKKCPTVTYPVTKYFGTGFVGEIPPEKFSVNENSWKQKENQPCVFNDDVIKDQFQTDVALWLNTILINKPVNSKIGGKVLKEKHISKLHETQKFLKRWFLLMAYSPMTYVTKENGSAKVPGTPDYQEAKPFPYPIASALSHGQRVVVVLQDLPNGKGLDKLTYNLLLSGDYEDKPIIDELRSFASHGTHQEPNGKVAEDKLVAGIMGALQMDHHMVNVPLGGVGNKNEMGYFIGAEGQSYDATKDTSVGSYQLGHIFIGVHRFQNGVSSLLMGVESTAPHKTSPFKTGGKSHDVTSGMKDATTNRSSTGGSKWANLLGGMAPATYGGMIINVNRTQLAKLKKLFDTVLSMKDQKQEELFSKLLTMNAQEANQYLRTFPELAEVFS